MGKRILGRNRLETVECHSGEADRQDPQEQYRDGEGETIGSAHANYHGIETLRIIGDHHTQWTGYEKLVHDSPRSGRSYENRRDCDGGSRNRSCERPSCDPHGPCGRTERRRTPQRHRRVFVTFRQLEPIHTRQVVEKARLSGTLSDGEYEEFLRWWSSTDVVEEADQSGHYRLGNAVSSTRSPDAHSEG